MSTSSKVSLVVRRPIQGARPWGKYLYSALIFLLPLFMLLALCGCNKQSNGLFDGYYTAEAMAYDKDGWKDYLTIFVNNGQITIVEYDARNMSGFRRSWDMDYMLDWHSNSGVRPGNHIISYQNALIALQNPDRIQPQPGARNMHANFVTLANSAIELSKGRQAAVAFVRLPGKEFPDDL